MEEHVREDTGPVLGSALLVLLALAIALIWGLDWRVFFTGVAAAVAAVLAAAALDLRRKEAARLAQRVATRKAMADSPMGRILQPPPAEELTDEQLMEALGRMQPPPGAAWPYDLPKDS